MSLTQARVRRLSDRAKPDRAKPDRAVPRILGLLPLAVGLAAWQVFGSQDSPYFPRPSQWAKAIVEMARDGTLTTALVETLSSYAICLVACILVGASLGALLGRIRWLDRALGPTLEFLRTLPAGALVPIAVIVIGYTRSMTLAVVTATAVWPIVLNVRQGALTISRERLDVAATLRMNRRERVTKIVAPSLFPHLLVGTQIAAPVVLIIVILVEILTQVGGLGQLLAISQQSYRSAHVYGLVVVMGVLGAGVNSLLALIRDTGSRFDTVGRIE